MADVFIQKLSALFLVYKNPCQQSTRRRRQIERKKKLKENWEFLHYFTLQVDYQTNPTKKPGDFQELIKWQTIRTNIDQSKKIYSKS